MKKFTANDARRMIMVLQGGPGSGHWGHAGRPGEKGGSLPSKKGASRTSGATAAMRQKVRRDISKDIATVRRDGDKIKIFSPYNENYVDELKGNLPYSQRKWNGTEWEVTYSERNAQLVNDLVDRHYHRMDASELNFAQRKQVRAYLQAERIKVSQKVILDNSDAINARIDSLTETIDSYGFSSQSSKKMNAITERARLEYTLQDARKNPYKLEEIQYRSLVKTANEYK